MAIDLPSGDVLTPRVAYSYQGAQYGQIYNRRSMRCRRGTMLM